ncbi:MAG TPA: FxLYD domain-containing protein [Thermoanaerobaculia bacterium]|nr:FxLYD domain-containing protein [Thermoanaerobaculia bacterium]
MKKLAVLLLPLLAVAATPAAADWLVTRSGERVDIQGPWQLKGKLVVFTRMDGSFASLRTSEVDLKASERVTAEEKAKKAAPAPAAAAPEKKKPVAVVTDETLAKARKPAPAPSPEPGQPAPPAAEPPASTGPAVLGAWDRRALEGAEGIELFGTLQNPGNKIAAGVAVTVQLFDEAGDLVESAEAVLDESSIAPGGMIHFRIPLPGLFTFADAKFRVKSFVLDFDPVPQEGEGPQ